MKSLQLYRQQANGPSGRQDEPDKSKHEVLTDKEVKGLGLCIMTIGDAEKAINFYADFIRRYALHGLLYRLCLVKHRKSNIDSHLWTSRIDIESETDAEKEITAIVLGLGAGRQLTSDSGHAHAANTPVVSVSDSGEGADDGDAESALFAAYIEDMGNFVVDPAPTTSESNEPVSILKRQFDFRIDCVIPESHRDSVWQHQLNILQCEYPTVDIVAKNAAVLLDFSSSLPEYFGDVARTTAP